VFCWNCGALAMLIPSIDLMGGKIVQLIQGEKKVLEFDDFSPWVKRFSHFPLVQLIDLDSALGRGSNRQLVESLCRELPCQVGGGVRSIASAKAILDAGAHRIIVGSSLFTHDGIDSNFADQLSRAVGCERLVFAVDSKNGQIVTRGWTSRVAMTPRNAIRLLEPWCHAFLYTHVDTEGLLQGFPLARARELRGATARQLIVAGGISSETEIRELEQLGADAVVGMAIYTHKILVAQGE
jgi:phosphoribosylformimino-5-aminoimidazole carboxamide ribotide isomerase